MRAVVDPEAVYLDQVSLGAVQSRGRGGRATEDRSIECVAASRNWNMDQMCSVWAWSLFPGPGGYPGAQPAHAPGGYLGTQPAHATGGYPGAQPAHAPGG